MIVIGQVPVVASTGGLVDTVKDGVTGFHIGSFNVDVSVGRNQPWVAAWLAGRHGVPCSC